MPVVAKRRNWWAFCFFNASGSLLEGNQERRIRPVFANTEIFGAVFRRIHSEKGEIHAPKFVFGGPQIRIRRP